MRAKEGEGRTFGIVSRLLLPDETSLHRSVHHVESITPSVSSVQAFEEGEDVLAVSDCFGGE
jgi:hypothetical protein